ncbi:ABC transporter substrate-binding protein [Tepidanaerobacter syntrophicus]|uniref:ABC transporter substrate-binding protein n=1 Tax=Tepidanaerobacter syntrophicus TaxID=224999 RepID=UPI001BD52FB1|nr:ABC transporter substrate-binding protein [Tepidanaerobacter syntrophicus]
MRRRIAIIATVLVMTFVVLSLAGCGPSSNEASKSTKGDTSTSLEASKNLIFGLSAEPTNLEPALAQGTAKRIINECIYRSLFSYDEKGKLSEELCSSYTIGEDNKTYTIQIRDAYFQNGDPVTSEDVKYTFERLLNPKTGATFFKELSVIDKIDIVDEKTVKFILKDVCAPFLHYLALPESAILSKSYTEEKGEDIANLPMGAGPYKFVKWDKGQSLVVEKNEKYYKPGLPKLDSITFNFYSDEDARSNALRSGDIDITDYVPWKDTASMMNDPNLTIHTEDGPIMLISFNTKVKPLDDPRVRKAIAYAVDRENIVKTVFFGRGKPITGFVLPEGWLGYDPDLNNYFEYNPEKAKQLLAEAGYSNGFDVRLLGSSSYSMHSQTAICIQSDLKKVGINVTLELPDWATRMNKVGEQDYEMFVNAMSAEFGDPDWLRNYMYGGEPTYNTSAWFNDSEVNRLLDEGRTTLDLTERDKIYKQLAKRLLDLSPHVYLNYREQATGMQKYVINYQSPKGLLCLSQAGMPLEKIDIKK